MLHAPHSENRMPEWLRQRARLSPERLGLIYGDERWTFGELDQRVSAMAGHLSAAGIRAGDIVALLARNGSRFVQAAHAVPRLGAVLMPLNVRWTAGELGQAIEDAKASLLAYDEANEAKAAELKAALPSLSYLSLEEGSGASASVGAEQFDLTALHSVIYTSGTSGRPKGATLTFGNHFWSAVGSALNLGLRPDDRWLACMPLFHVGGLAILLRSVIYGNTAIVHEAFDPAAVNRSIDDEGITIVSVVATMLQRMLEERGERPYPDSLRCVLAGGGPVPRPLLEECSRRGVPVVQTYGLTEAASQVTTLAPNEAPARLGSAGRPLFTTEVRIEAGDGSAAPPGEPGEIVIRGPTVTPGYLNQPEATEQALNDGWLRTGDVGRLDGEGYLYVLDRRDDLIVSGGENVYPAEVEEALRSHPSVLDAGVTGLADERWGQTVVAAVVLSTSARLSEEELLSFCRERLAAYKSPTRLRFVEQLPRNAAGKLLRHVLREQWALHAPS